MTRTTTILGLCVLGCSLAISTGAGAARPSTPKFFRIDVPGAGGTTMPRRIGNNGRIIGTYLDRSKTEHVFERFHGAYTTIDPPIPAGCALTEVCGNGLGDIAGAYTDTDKTSHGFVWLKGRYARIECPTARYMHVYDINDNDEVVGMFYSFGSGATHGFRFYRGRLTLIDIPGADVVNIFGINDKGQIAGTFEKHKVVGAFVWKDGVRRSIIGPAGEEPIPFGINDEGQVVGEYFGRHAGNGTGFLWSDGKFTTVSFPSPLSRGSTAFGVNDKGQIVGFYHDAKGNILGGFLRNP